VGLLTRVAAVGMRCAMLVALISVHGSHGFVMHWTGTQQGESCEYHRCMIGITLTVLMRGADIWLLDWMRAGCTPRPRTQNEGFATAILQSGNAWHCKPCCGRLSGGFCATEASSLQAAPSWTNPSARAMMPGVRHEATTPSGMSIRGPRWRPLATRQRPLRAAIPVTGGER